MINPRHGRARNLHRHTAIKSTVARPCEIRKAGYDCEKNGANLTNCHFALFATAELTKAWEQGKEDYKKEKT